MVSWAVPFRWSSAKRHRGSSRGRERAVYLRERARNEFKSTGVCWKQSRGTADIGTSKQDGVYENAIRRMAELRVLKGQAMTMSPLGDRPISVHV